MVDEAGAIGMFVAENRTFIDQNTHDFVVIHKTASGGSAQNIATFFANDPAMASTHYVVGQDGAIAQCVLEKDGAGGNCCLETGHASYLPTGVNLNVKTVSIEHVDPASDNSTPLTNAQKAASFRLVQHICERHNIPKRRATNDGQGGIIGHCDIAPLSRARCPGNYPWDELFAYLKGGKVMSGVPAGWRDTNPSDPNGVLYSPSHVQGGPEVPITGLFRQYVLANGWRPSDRAIEIGHHVNELEYSNASLGSGWTQQFLYSRLEKPDSGVLAGKVVYAWLGVEANYLRAGFEAQLAEIATLKQEIAAHQPGLDAAQVQARLTALGKIFQEGGDLAAQPIQ